MENIRNIWLTTFLFILFGFSSFSKAYGFSKCAQYELDSSHVICINKQIVNLTEAIGKLPPSTTHLNVTHNHVQRLHTKSFAHLPSLVDLRLEWNKIKDIEKGAFCGLENLTLLNLIENHIRSLNKSTFGGLINLCTLLLNKNRITWIAKEAFGPLINLQNLNFAQNPMSNFLNIISAIHGMKQLLTLDLTNNSIAKVSLSSYILHSLQTLSLQGNHIQTLDFSNLTLPNLTKLDLSNNRLKHINMSSFQNLPQLAVLNLGDNFIDISQLDSDYMKNITDLDLSNLTTIQSNPDAVRRLLQNLPKMVSLIIQNNKMELKDLKQIGNHTHLLSLDLFGNRLQQLTDNDFQHFQNLLHLILEHCNLSVISNNSWAMLKHLTHLQLKHNNIKHLQDYVFTPLKGLQSLELSWNPLTEFNGLAFYGLNRLKYLNLRACWITTLHPSSFTHLAALLNLTLQQNNLREISKHTFSQLKNLTMLTLSSNRISKISDDAFEGLTNLKYLDLAFNFLQSVQRDMFKGLKTLEHLDLRSNKISFETTRKLKCPPFSHLKSLRYLNLAGQIPQGIQVIPVNFFEELTNLRMLYMGKNKMVFFDTPSLDPLTNLTFLDISGVGDRGLTLNESLFKNLKRLRILRLEENYMETIPVDLISSLESLQIFSLRFNDIKNISKEFIHGMRSLTYFDLYKNSLDCLCDNAWFRNWSVHSSTVQVPYLGSYLCAGPVRKTVFVDFDYSICNSYLGKFLFISTCMVILLTLISSLVTAKLSWFIRYTIYMAKAWLSSSCQRVQKLYTYDAFVSYNSNDEKWIFKELVPNLEENMKPPIKLCLHHRDFELGVDIFENIQSAISNSRKTLCVVSNNYLRSEWCRLEVQLASLRLFDEYHDALILILLESIPDYRLSNYHKVRKLVKKQTYISWPEDPAERQLFWARLENALRQKRVDESNMQLNVAE
uniref:toll-like receptor 13 n=1 Tax=Pristiophorus japonicus TaxID=55135 RepID=UPI00398E9191